MLVVMHYLAVPPKDTSSSSSNRRPLSQAEHIMVLRVVLEAMVQKLAKDTERMETGSSPRRSKKRKISLPRSRRLSSLSNRMFRLLATP